MFTRYLRPVVAGILLLCGLAAFGGSEWVREGLRKPYVLGNYMFVNGVRLPVKRGFIPSHNGDSSTDPFSIESTSEVGVLRVAKWTPFGEHAEYVAEDLGWIPRHPGSGRRTKY
jgi:hypothetical protein